MLAAEKADAIVAAADEVLDGRHAGEFPLAVWQTGCGTQTNMNVNEVIANRASSCSAARAAKAAWSTRTTTSTAASRRTTCSRPRCTSRPSRRSSTRLLPAVGELRDDARRARPATFADIVKIGRTHLQDATPLTLGQEISGWVAQLDHGMRAHRDGAAAPARAGARRHGGRHRAERAARVRRARRRRAVARGSDLPFVTAPNKFEALAAHDALVHAHGALKTLAASLIKIANDVRWLASGPRCGLGEIRIPGERAGQLDHAGQGQPDAVRGDDDAVLRR